MCLICGIKELFILFDDDDNNDDDGDDDDEEEENDDNDNDNDDNQNHHHYHRLKFSNASTLEDHLRQDGLLHVISFTTSV